jgi:hypothetical protein
MKRGQAGFSLIELVIASFIGFVAMAGILYLYKGQSKNMLLQSGTAEMRMNGQFALNEAQYYLAHMGLGLPPNLKNLFIASGDLVIRMNSSKKSAAAVLRAASTSASTVYRIDLADTGLFTGKAYAAALVGSQVLEAPVTGVVQDPSDPGGALVSLAADKKDFAANTTLYPVERVRLHRCTGLGADTSEGDFRVLQDNPGLRAGIRQDSLTLAEGIESLSFRYFLINRDSVSSPPSSLDSLRKVEVIVVAISKVKDRDRKGDGYTRDTLSAKVGYRRSL